MLNPLKPLQNPKRKALAIADDDYDDEVAEEGDELVSLMYKMSGSQLKKQRTIKR